MWAALYAFFGLFFDILGRMLASVFSFIKSNTSADYQSVNQMQKDINSELRNDIKLLKEEMVKNKATAEEAERKCNKRISTLIRANIVLRAQVKQLMTEREEMIANRAEREKPEYQARTIAHTTGIVKEEERATKLEASDEDTKDIGS